MENDHLRFACPSCGTNLMLPAAAAGVEGPCPQCNSVIRAPRPRAVRLEVPETEPARAKPVFSTFHMPAEVPGDSKVVQSGKRATLKRNVAIGTSALVIVAAALVVILRGKEQPPLTPAASRVESTAKPSPLTATAFSGQTINDKTGIDPALDPRVPPEGMDVRALIQESADVLKTSAQAKTLAERLPVIETKTPKEELEASVLAGPIPSRQRFQSTEVRFDKVGGASDVVFLGVLQLPTGGAESHVIKVGNRAPQSPKIIVDPFLDGYGGRLKQFAAAPVTDQRTFRVIASFFEFCSDANVPGAGSKFTAKLSEAPAKPEVAEAYFAALSPVEERLEKLGLRYGHSTGVTFTLRWNSEDDPGKPFLEVVSVQALDWND